MLTTLGREAAMKRDWDVIREVLIEVEGLTERERNTFQFSLGYEEGNQSKGEQALLLWKAGYLEAIESGGLDGPAIVSPQLTWAGHDLLDTLRSKPVWEKIKLTAKEKGIELTFEAVKFLGRVALDPILKG
jgi:hypothetical protein